MATYLYLTHPAYPNGVSRSFASDVAADEFVASLTGAWVVQSRDATVAEHVAAGIAYVTAITAAKRAALASGMSGNAGWIGGFTPA